MDADALGTAVEFVMFLYTTLFGVVVLYYGYRLGNAVFWGWESRPPGCRSCGTGKRPSRTGP